MKRYLPLLFCLFAVTATVRWSAAQPPRSTAKSSAPADVVHKFYEWYLQSLANHRDPMTQDRANIKTYVSAALIREIDRLSKTEDGLDADYFLKAQDFEDNWKTNIVVTPAKAQAGESAFVVLLGKGAEARKLMVHLRNEASSWKISKVDSLRN